MFSLALVSNLVYLSVSRITLDRFSQNSLERRHMGHETKKIRIMLRWTIIKVMLGLWIGGGSAILLSQLGLCPYVKECNGLA